MPLPSAKIVCEHCLITKAIMSVFLSQALFHEKGEKLFSAIGNYQWCEAGREGRLSRREDGLFSLKENKSLKTLLLSNLLLEEQLLPYSNFYLTHCFEEQEQDENQLVHDLLLDSNRQNKFLPEGFSSYYAISDCNIIQSSSEGRSSKLSLERARESLSNFSFINSERAFSISELLLSPEFDEYKANKSSNDGRIVMDIFRLTLDA